MSRQAFMQWHYNDSQPSGQKLPWNTFNDKMQPNYCLTEECRNISLWFSGDYRIFTDFILGTDPS